MAIKSNVVIETNRERNEYPEAYLKVVKVISSNTDYEFFENVDDPDNPEIHQKLSWVSRLENHATVYIWSDRVARANNVQPVHWFSYKFDLDFAKKSNIYEQAYDVLKLLYPNYEDVV